MNTTPISMIKGALESPIIVLFYGVLGVKIGAVVPLQSGEEVPLYGGQVAVQAIPTALLHLVYPCSVPLERA